MPAQQAISAIPSCGDMIQPYLDGLPFPVIVLDEEGRVIYLNKECPRSVDAGPAGRGDLQELFPEYFSALRGEPPWLTPQEAEVERHVSGRAVHERICLRRVPGGSCLIVVDRTRLRELETADAQTARLASLGFMLAGVCHELSNPLAAIFSMVQILQANRNISPDALDKGLANIAANVKRILDVSRRLVGFSRTGDEPKLAFRVDEAIEDAMVILRHDQKFGQIAFEHRPDAHAVAFGNPGQMQEVFYNIFLNAIQAMEGQGRLCVTTHRPAVERIEVVIRDTGPGIPPQILPRLFEPFLTTKPIGEGTGLGLSISNEIVHEHGGTIAVENNAEKGACFYVRLPLFEGRP